MSIIIEKAEKFVLDLFKENLPNTFIYHDFTHTRRVFKSTKEIIKNSEINVNEEQILLLAALFHDTGYIKVREGHEEESVKIATEFLTSENVDQDTIAGVNKCIMATKFKDSPNSKLEEIILDLLNDKIVLLSFVPESKIKIRDIISEYIQSLH